MPASAATGRSSPGTCAPTIPATSATPPISSATSRATRARAAWSGCSRYEAHRLHRLDRLGESWRGCGSRGGVGDGVRGFRAARKRGGRPRREPAALGALRPAPLRGGRRAARRQALESVREGAALGGGRSAAEGEKLFSAMNCDGCHGGGAVGWVGPSLIDGRWRYGEADAAVFQSIYYGRPQGMPAFGGMLSSDLIWKLVSYLRSLPPPKAVPTQAW
ncbi:MAG: hypothetical protein DMD43_09235 [Gemmatimonadetes bacterium]|nr:MAG: hypothetical protein DMD43_09235 [Gemmatimonadota bacterium]